MRPHPQMSLQRPRFRAAWLWLVGFLLMVMLSYSFMQPTLLRAQDRTLYPRPLVEIEIRYTMPDASEVLLVWGVDGWQPMPVETRPFGTRLDNGIMQTPMVREGDTFSVVLQAPAHAMITYGFQITKASNGQPVSVYETGLTGPLQVLAVEGIVIGAQTRKSLSPVILEIHYTMPEAGRVLLAWGVSGWQLVPEGQRPAGTKVSDGTMHTPMVRADNGFVAQVQVIAGTAVDFGFLITETLNGTPVSAWDGNHNAVAGSVDSVITVESELTLLEAQLGASSSGVPLVVEEIRQRFPEASEVYLIWGVDGWRQVPELQRPPGTLVINNVMQSPMAHEGDDFVLQLLVPAGATIEYGFMISDTQGGPSVLLWDGDDAYRIEARQPEELAQAKTGGVSSQGEVAPDSTRTSLVTQEIRYHQPEAGEVFLVWTMQGGGLVSEEAGPPGTVMQADGLHTPMAREGSIFVVKLQVPPGTTLDYNFLITREIGGDAVDVLEASPDRPFRTVAMEDGTTDVESAKELAKGPVAIDRVRIGISLLLLGATLILAVGAALGIKRIHLGATR